MDETFLVKFPEMAEKIFEQLNNEDLIKSKEVTQAWCDLIDQRLVWKRMVQSCTRKVEHYKSEFNLVLKKIPRDNLKKFALACLGSKYLLTDNLDLFGEIAPLHVAAHYGDLLLFKYILKKSHVKNPKDKMGDTPYHVAAGHNKLEICKFYIENTKNKKLPKDYRGRTPLHDAADEGHFDVFKLIFHHAQDKNPRKNNGRTPLHNAAVENHLEICKFIVLEVEDKNPEDETGDTPLHAAAMHGYSELYKFIAERVNEKNPLNNEGRTPLHEAIDNGHLHICRILLDILGIENPTLAEPKAKCLCKE